MRRWALGCLVVLLAGAAALGWSSVPVVPDCDGLPMGPGDRCIVLEGGIGQDEGVFTYEEAVEGQGKSKRYARALGWSLMAGGVLALVVGTAAWRWEAAQRRGGRRGPEAVAGAVAAADLGDHVCSVGLRGERRLHLHRRGIVVERRDVVEEVVAWRDVDDVQVETRPDPDGVDWVHTCVLRADGRRVRLRAGPQDRSTLGALRELVAAARTGEPPD